MSELPPIPRPEQRPLPPAGGPRRIVLPPHRERARRPRSVRVREWVRRNLFPSWRGTLLTALAAGVLGLIAAGVIAFVFFGANWEVITHNRWLLFAGGFPREEAWRLWVSIALVFGLIGLAYGTWSSLGRRDHLFVLLVGGFVIFLMAHGGAEIWSSVYFLIAVGCMYLGYLLTYQLPRATSSLRTLQVRVVGGLLVLALPIVLLLLLVGGNVGIRSLDGFVLNSDPGAGRHRRRHPDRDSVGRGPRFQPQVHLLDVHRLHRNRARGAVAGLALRGAVHPRRHHRRRSDHPRDGRDGRLHRRLHGRVHPRRAASIAARTV